jgi:zinc D-Ala-D-Ala carboxypeptidase
MDLKYFDISEFDSPDLQGTAILHMDSEFLLLLDQIREQYGRPIHINSGYRTAERNRMVGGKADSAHLRGLAADLRCDNSRDRHDLLEAIFSVGIHRVGIAKSFIHIDNDKSKAERVVWLYS